MNWMGTFWRLSWNAYPGALCYTVYKLVDSEYVIVAECIDGTELDLDDLGPGTYVPVVITPDGETDGDPITTPDPPIPPVPPPIPCSGSGDPIPDSFLVPLDAPDLIQVFSTNSNEAHTDPAWDWGGKTGRFELFWISGHVSATCMAWVERSNGNFFGREYYGWGDSLIDWTDSFTAGPVTGIQTYGCFVPPNPPCDPEADIVADRPDGAFMWKVIAPGLRDLWAALGLINQEITWAGTQNFSSCGGGGCTCDTDGADPLIYHVIRTHEFITQPATITIQNLAGQISQLDGAAEPWGGAGHPAWTGLINGTVSYWETSWENTLFDPFVMLGASLITSVQVQGLAGNQWTLEIWAERYVAGVPQAYLLFTGEKLYGETPLGDYTTTSAANPNPPDCLTLV
jgi:hypothetical protein